MEALIPTLYRKQGNGLGFLAISAESVLRYKGMDILCSTHSFRLTLHISRLHPYLTNSA